MIPGRRGGLRALVESHRAATAFVLLVILHAPILFAYGRGLLSREYYQFFPVLWIALVILVFRRGSSVLIVGWYHWPWLLLDGLCLIVASLYRSPWLGFAGFCAGCLAVLGAGRDNTTGRPLWPLALLPLITLRPPLSLDEQMIARLQLTTTHAASSILRALDLLHYRRGVIIELPDRELFIDEACSGIHSLFTLLGLAALIVLVHRRHWLASVLLLGSAVIWALLLNIVRVVVIVLAHVWWGVNLASGLPHDVLGYVLVGIALICLLSTDQLLQLFTSPIRERAGEGLGITKDNPLVRAFNWFFRSPSESRLSPPEPRYLPASPWRQAMLVIGGVVLVAVQFISLPPRLEAKPQRVGAETFAAGALDGEYDGWQRGECRTKQRDRDSMWGEQSCVWDFSRGPQVAQLSVDSLFRGWHELTVCYENTGWRIVTREARRSEASPDGWPFVVAVMRNDDGRYGISCFSSFDEAGQPVFPAHDELAAALASRWKDATGRLGTYQVQVFSTTLVPPSEEDIELLVRLLCQTRRDLVAFFLSRSTSAGRSEPR
jgi:exosortase